MRINIYEAIFKRKSIRNYDPAPIDQNILKQISDNLNSLKPMVTEIKTEFKIISPNQVTRKLQNNAPYYIAAFSETKEYLQSQHWLHASTNGPLFISDWIRQLLAGFSATNQRSNRVFKSSIYNLDVFWKF